MANCFDRGLKQKRKADQNSLAWSGSASSYSREQERFDSQFVAIDRRWRLTVGRNLSLEVVLARLTSGSNLALMI